MSSFQSQGHVLLCSVYLRQVCQLLKFKVAIEKWLRPPDSSFAFMSPTYKPVLAVKGNVYWVTMLSSAKESLFRIH